ncbi:efflux RND transporter periplasmic adaptor subunit [Thiomicrorhabdus sp.]|uniref:efflux RND transporter periplasmic adaptor subunit n=1 Tax=Thiomicrorhabdus sp. TaxID=2039724 RepID=UPI0029C8BC8F|nr:efflux RND transporter periplasmic adaptor subunit [Thiomicrorhabdus sp.]
MTKRSAKTGKLAVLLVVILLVAAAWSLYWFVWKTESGPATTFSTAEVVRGDIDHLVTATGSLQPRDYVDVGAQVSGQLKILHVEVGSQVKAGDLLAEIDPTVFLAKVDESRAQLRYQKAQLKEKQAKLELARINAKRQQRLFKKQATTEEAMLTAKAELVANQAQIEMIQAQIDQTESGLRADEANLKYAQIYAPMDGTIVSISAKQGQTLNANQQAPIILQIADLTTMTVQTQVSEADVSKLQPGMEVYFTTLGSGQRRWQGVLQKIEPTPEVVNNVVLYNALFEVPNRRSRLMSQMTAQVFFVVDAARDALLVPVSALKFKRPSRGGVRKADVQLLKVDGSRETREVEVGVSNRVQAQILSGVAEGEVVITNKAAKRSGNKTSEKGNRRMGPPGPRLG